MRPLLDALDREYTERYGDNDEIAAYGPSEFAPPGGVFLVLEEEEGVVLAGGGVRRLSASTGEIKRMWTAAPARRRGLARLVLMSLEDEARTRGYDELRLETGTEQPEAVAFYASAGYEAVAPYGRYRDDPRSICMAKRL